MSELSTSKKPLGSALTPVDQHILPSPSRVHRGTRSTVEPLHKTALLASARSAPSGIGPSPSEEPIFGSTSIQPMHPAALHPELPQGDPGHQGDLANSLAGPGVGASPRRTSAPEVPTLPRTGMPGTLISSATPHRVSSHDSERSYKIIEDIQLAVNAELVDAWVEEDKTCPFQRHLEATVNQEYPGLDERVTGWLEKYDGYDSVNKTWKTIGIGAKEATIYDPLVTIMSAIVKDFGHETEDVGGSIKRRMVTNTHRQFMLHNASDASGTHALKSEPDISFFGTGPSATRKLDFSPHFSYGEVASLWEVKTLPTFEGKEKGQVGVYAREVFIQQPNRRFVYVPIMTSQVIRVLRFDRAGCYYSQRIDYHQNAHFFVKLVVLLSSFNERLLGFDTSIYWENGQRLLKIPSAEIFKTSPERWETTEELVFKLADEPMFSRRTIRSRGTVCWRAEYGGKEYVVKDYWRAEGRAKESAFLKDLVGIKGVGQMFTFQDDIESIKAERGFADAETMTSDRSAKSVLDRWFMRLVLPKYGDTLEKAGSARELLCAIRDAVGGHAASLQKGILHRDISFSNILLSPYDECGVVIDWDLAKTMENLVQNNATDGDSRTGTRAYQSVKVLSGSPKLGHHDHMDDLESVSYVLYSILFGYDDHGNADPLSSNIRHWHDPNQDPTALSSIKRSFLRDPTAERLIRYADEGDILTTLVDNIRVFFGSRLDSIVDATRPKGSKPFPPYSEIVAQKEYADFIALIEDAIQKLPVMQPAPATPALPSPSGSVRSMKRQRDGDDDEAKLPTPVRKKPTPAHLPNQALPSSKGPRRSERGHYPVSNDHSAQSDSESDDDRPPSPTPASRRHDNMDYTPLNDRCRSTAAKRGR